MREPKTVYILFSHGASLEYFFSPNSPNGVWIEYLLKQSWKRRGYAVKFTNDASNLTDFAALISWETDEKILQNLASYPREKCILIVFEPPHVYPKYYSEETKERFGKILVFFDDAVDNETYFRMYIPFMERSLVRPREIPDFEEKKLCVAIQGNKYFHPHPDELYSERRKAFHFFSETGEFDLYGPGWQGNPCWKGIAPDPLNQTFKNYKFSLIYENWKNYNGYLTERLFAGLSSGSVPAYWGAANVTDYVPKECFIDLREFSSHREVYEFMRAMSRETYEKYQEAAVNYFQTTDKLNPFTKEYWIETLMSHVPKLSSVG